jgi:hypothetical protein
VEASRLPHSLGVASERRGRFRKRPKFLSRSGVVAEDGALPPFLVGVLRDELGGYRKECQLALRSEI